MAQGHSQSMREEALQQPPLIVAMGALLLLVGFLGTSCALVEPSQSATQSQQVKSTRHLCEALAAWFHSPDVSTLSSSRDGVALGVSVGVAGDGVAETHFFLAREGDGVVARGRSVSAEDHICRQAGAIEAGTSLLEAGTSLEFAIEALEYKTFEMNNVDVPALTALYERALNLRFDSDLGESFSLPTRRYTVALVTRMESLEVSFFSSYAPGDELLSHELSTSSQPETLRWLAELFEVLDIHSR